MENVATMTAIASIDHPLDQIVAIFQTAFSNVFSWLYRSTDSSIL